MNKVHSAVEMRELESFPPAYTALMTHHPGYTPSTSGTPGHTSRYSSSGAGTPSLTPTRSTPSRTPSGHACDVTASAICVHFTLYEDTDCRCPHEGHPGTGVYADDYWEKVKRMQKMPDFMEGIFLKCADIDPLFPFAHYTIFAREVKKPVCGNESIPSLDPPCLLHECLVMDAGTQASYDEICTFKSPKVQLIPKRPSNPNSAYLIGLFRTEQFTNLESLDELWSYWSGAEYMVKSLPDCLDLQRITFHKVSLRNQHSRFSSNTELDLSDAAASSSVTSSESGESRAIFTYMLLVEMAEVVSHLAMAKQFVQKLRDRQCGHFSLFLVDHFF